MGTYSVTNISLVFISFFFAEVYLNEPRDKHIWHFFLRKKDEKNENGCAKLVDMRYNYSIFFMYHVRPSQWFSHLKYSRWNIFFFHSFTPKSQRRKPNCLAIVSVFILFSWVECCCFNFFSWWNHVYLLQLNNVHFNIYDFPVNVTDNRKEKWNATVTFESKKQSITEMQFNIFIHKYDRKHIDRIFFEKL